MANKEYFITKLSFREDGKLIQDVFAYEYDGKCLSDGEDHLRQWFVNRTTEGYQISILAPDEKGLWQRGKPFKYTNGYYSWEHKLPENITRRKTFVSYYHHDNEEDRTIFENLFGDLVLSKSVEDGDIDSDNSDDYIKQLIQKEYLKDTTVLVVLIGNKTKCRKHVDWEISGALNYKVGNTYAGLIGLILPEHPDYGTEKAKYDLMPTRLADNFKTGYAVVADWTENRKTIQSYIELAFNSRINLSEKRDNSRAQMQRNTCE